jgi:hypothetical protein
MYMYIDKTFIGVVGLIIVFTIHLYKHSKMSNPKDEIFFLLR